jgi:hypothetical protein
MMAKRNGVRMGSDPPSGVTREVHWLALDEETAREIAIEQYQMQPQQQRSLLVRKA